MDGELPTSQISATDPVVGSGSRPRFAGCAPSEPGTYVRGHLPGASVAGAQISATRADRPGGRRLSAHSLFPLLRPLLCGLSARLRVAWRKCFAIQYFGRTLKIHELLCNFSWFFADHIYDARKWRPTELRSSRKDLEARTVTCRTKVKQAPMKRGNSM